MSQARRSHESLDEDRDEYFRVLIRVRPPLERELSSPMWLDIVQVQDTQITLSEAVEADRTTGCPQVLMSHTFTFDRVYDRGAPQPEVYESSAHPSVLSTLEGYNATILAYGPTGTGKTHTMEGARDREHPESRGIIPRSMEMIFHQIRERGPQSRFLVRASYLQIYNEVLSDLMKPDRSHLLIREDRKRGVFVEGLSEWLCRSPAEVRTLMERGSAARATAQTAANDASSRSHAVFIVIVEQSTPEEREDRPQQCVRVGRLNLVDLAGSERPRLTGATGQRLEETKKINQSLSALGNVMMALTEKRLRQHLPYRDSKLTRLLEDSLGGNCRTTMMAMLSPAAEALTESLSTLKFAHRAKAIRNTPTVNEDIDQRTLLRRYEAELKRLKSALRDKSEGMVDQRRLHELEEGRRQAEEDREAAVSALMERSMVLEEEKRQKQQLEERIRQMSSQMLVGGREVEASPQFRNAVAEHERIRSGYAAKLAELEKERGGIEEDKAQVGRYKQLLLKQRDIMIALTQRLHERDETIIALQDELDSRDHRLAELQEQSEHAARHGGPDPASSVSGTPWKREYSPENGVFDVHSEKPMQLLTADEKVAELSSVLDGLRQENHRLALEHEDAQLASSEHATLLDRIAEGLLAVGGPSLVKLRLSQDVMALKSSLSRKHGQADVYEYEVTNGPLSQQRATASSRQADGMVAPETYMATSTALCSPSFVDPQRSASREKVRHVWSDGDGRLSADSGSYNHTPRQSEMRAIPESRGREAQASRQMLSVRPGVRASSLGSSVKSVAQRATADVRMREERRPASAVNSREVRSNSLRSHEVLGFAAPREALRFSVGSAPSTSASERFDTFSSLQKGSAPSTSTSERFDAFPSPNSLPLSASAAPAADVLREEAQRSVDALLARRKAELRRANG